MHFIITFTYPNSYPYSDTYPDSDTDITLFRY
jgi:hypothetical protein